MTKDTTKDTPSRRSQNATSFLGQNFEEMEESFAKTKGGKKAQKAVSTRRSGTDTLFSRHHFEEMDQQLAKTNPGKKVVPREEDEEEGEATFTSKRRNKITDQPHAEGNIGRGHKRGRKSMTGDEGESGFFAAPSPCLKDDRAPKRLKIDEQSRQDEKEEDMSVDDETMDEDMQSGNGVNDNEERDDEDFEDDEEGNVDEDDRNEDMEPEDGEEESVDEDNMDENEESNDEEFDEKSENDEEGRVTEDGMDEDEDDDVQEITPTRSRSSTPHVIEHNPEEPALINSTRLLQQQRQSNKPSVIPAPNEFMNYLTPEGTISTRPVYKFSDLPNKLVLEIFELLHNEDDPKPISAICFGLTCKNHWGWFKQRWCIPFSEYSIYQGCLPKEDQAILAPLLQDWVPNNYRMMSGIGGKGGPSIVPMFLSRKAYGEGYSREEERLENRYNACVSILDAENQDGMRLISSHGFRTAVDDTIDLPSPHGMGHSWYDAAASEYLLKVETWEWSTLDGDDPGYKAICESWHSFTMTSLWDWVNGKGFNQFQEDWMDDEGMKGRKEIKEVFINFDRKVTRFEMGSST